MALKTSTTKRWTLASVALRDAFTDFFLSRQAMQCSPETLRWYQHTAGAFLTWIESQGIGRPDEVSARHVRQYLAGLTDRGKSDATANGHARAVRTLLRFWHREKYMPELVTFEMPRVAKKRLPVLGVEELRAVIAACAGAGDNTSARDKAIVLLMADSGLRCSEVCALDWEDVEFSNGMLRVRRGKGGKARTAVIGVTARRALLAYRRTGTAAGPMFVSKKRGRLTRAGMDLIFRRLSQRSGIHVTPHALRRTFVILSLRAGMSATHLQALGGWSGLEMVSHYAQLEDIDLLQAHKEHSPIDRLVRSNRRRRAQRRRK